MSKGTPPLQNAILKTHWGALAREQKSGTTLPHKLPEGTPYPRRCLILLRTLPQPSGLILTRNQGRRVGFLRPGAPQSLPGH